MSGEVALETLFDADGERWLPKPYARGPFDGMQGGAVAALMCAVAERSFPEGLTTVGIDARFLRPCPLAPIEVAVRPLQVGARLALFETSLSADGKIRAVATVTAIRPQRIEAVPEPAPERQDPAAGVVRPAPPIPHDKPWLMDRMEARSGEDGVAWFHFDQPVTGTESSFARALCPTDWLPGITRPDSWAAPIVAAAPNVDLSVRASRPVRGPWYGIDAAARWSRDGWGVARGALLDVDGIAAAISCTIALVPRGD